MTKPFKTFVNLTLILVSMATLSAGSYKFCESYGCNSWTNFLRADIICNACVDVAYHLKNYQISLYGSIFTLMTYHMTSLINKAGVPSETYIFQDYKLGRNSPKPRPTHFKPSQRASTV